jgi:hypothetical protein
MSGLSLNPVLSADQSILSSAPQRLRDNLGRFEVSEVQNLFEADFEYSTQPMRWENYIVGGATIAQVPGSGGVLMSVTSAAGDIAIRQTRPYIRYQPGKTIYMASGTVFGAAYANQTQRVGFFDDGNGIFFEQSAPTVANPSGMGVVYRTDVNSVPTDTRISYENWSDPQGIKSTVNWSIIQMIWIEFAWYGAGLLRWGVMIGGEPYVLHQVGIGNKTAQTVPWSRTGNIPVRYELRNSGATTAGTLNHYGVSVLAKGKIDVQRGFTYGYGMAPTVPARSVIASSTRFPLLSIRYRAMGTLEYGVDAAYSGANGTLPTGGSAISGVTSSAASTVITTGATWTVNQWAGKYVFCRGSSAAITSITVSGTTATVTTTANPNYLTTGRYLTISGATGNATVNGLFQITVTGANTFTYTASTITTGAVGGTLVYTSGQGAMGRIISNTATALTVVDNISGTGPMVAPPAASGNYIIGEIDRGQVLPQTLNIYSSANCTLELIASTFYSVPVPNGTGYSFATMYSLGSLNSFVERDVSATGSITGGEVVYVTPLPSGGLQNYDLSNFFPLYTTVQGNMPDILTVAITNPSGSAITVGASIIAQEAMS